MIQASYRPEQAKAMVDHPQNRAEASRKLVEALGGKLECLYFAFGDSDIVAISEFPDNEAAMACALAVAGGGTTASYKTTVLITPEQAMEAMKKAGGAAGSYRSPSG
jgi:uncharacterized protein with GYD domain